MRKWNAWGQAGGMKDEVQEHNVELKVHLVLV